MKSNISRALVSFAVITILSPLGFARTGPGSGNGDGDRAFALQKLAAANPSLTPAQILMKAFDESAGRVPNLQFEPARSSGVQKIATGKIFEMKSATKGLEIDIGTASTFPPTEIRVTDEFEFKKTTSAYGPLIPDSTDKVNYWAKSGHYQYSGEATTCNGSLCLEGIGKPWIEIRLFNDKTVLFITRSVLNEDQKPVCGPLAGQTATTYKPTKADEVCSVGYFWVE